MNQCPTNVKRRSSSLSKQRNKKLYGANEQAETAQHGYIRSTRRYRRMLRAVRHNLYGGNADKIIAAMNRRMNADAIVVNGKGTMSLCYLKAMERFNFVLLNDRWEIV